MTSDLSETTATVLRAANGRLRLIWRLPLFALLLAALIAPLLLLDNALLQFLFAALLLTGLLWHWGRRIDQHGLSDYGLVASRAMFGEFAAGCVIGVGAIAAVFAISWQAGLVGPIALHATVVSMGFWLFLAKAMVVAYWEEALFRGFLITTLRDSFRLRLGDRNAAALALILSSLMFGLAHAGTDHFSWAALAVLSLNGLVLGLPFLLTGRLGLSIGMHAAWNFAQTKLFGFAMSGNAADGSLLTAPLSGPNAWTGGAYGPEAGFAGVVGLAIMALFAVAVARVSQPLSRRLPL